MRPSSRRSSAPPSPTPHPQTFSEIDVNHSRSISADEFLLWFNSNGGPKGAMIVFLMRRSAARAARAAAAEAHAMLRSAMVACARAATTREHRNYLRKYDVDDSGDCDRWTLAAVLREMKLSVYDREVDIAFARIDVARCGRVAANVLVGWMMDNRLGALIASIKAQAAAGAALSAAARGQRVAQDVVWAMADLAQRQEEERLEKEKQEEEEKELAVVAGHAATASNAAATAAAWCKTYVARVVGRVEAWARLVHAAEKVQVRWKHVAAAGSRLVYAPL